jgi:hypothetical protein
LKLEVGEGASGLRTGFNFETDTICFPENSSVRNGGLDSVDVITHEVFHALTFQSYPELFSGSRATAKESVRLHEALADYFTYQLYPDEHFGENYHTEKPHLRRYRNRRRVSLSPGAHSQGNAITSYLLKHEVEPSQIREFLSRGDFTLKGLQKSSPELQGELKRDASFSFKDTVSNYPPSSLRRYRIEPQRPLEVSFKANDPLKKAHPNLSVEWVNPQGYPSRGYLIEGDGDRFTVEPRGDADPEKVIAVFRDGEDVVGARPFYFGPAFDETHKPDRDRMVSFLENLS